MGEYLLPQNVAICLSKAPSIERSSKAQNYSSKRDGFLKMFFLSSHRILIFLLPQRKGRKKSWWLKSTCLPLNNKTN